MSDCSSSDLKLRRGPNLGYGGGTLELSQGHAPLRSSPVELRTDTLGDSPYGNHRKG